MLILQHRENPIFSILHCTCTYCPPLVTSVITTNIEKNKETNQHFCNPLPYPFSYETLSHKNVFISGQSLTVEKIKSVIDR